MLLPAIDPGGGEFARDCEVDAIDILSSTALDGVPGGLIDATLGRLDATFAGTEGTAEVASLGVGGTAGAGSLGVVTPAGGVSDFGVATTRKVFGAAFTAGEATLGDSTLDVADDCAAALACPGVSACFFAEVVWASSLTAADMSSFPGGGFLFCCGSPFAGSALLGVTGTASALLDCTVAEPLAVGCIAFGTLF